MTLSPQQASELLVRHGITPSRALGQNFVVDPNTVRRIARLANLTAGDHVLEVGPGMGSLTLALAEAGAHVTALELDRHLVPVLTEVVAAADPPVRVVQGDAMATDYDALLGGHDGPWSMVANLPYNVATPLVLDLLVGVPRIERYLVMVQAEVGDRLAAQVGSPAYGIPSVKVAYWATATVVGRVPPTVFIPKPRVDSALVRIERRPQPAVDVDRALLFGLIDAGFGQRRKMLRRSLVDRVTAEQFEQAAVRPDARAEELSIDDWGRLATAVSG